MVRVAREHGFRIHVQSTGHGAVEPIGDGVLITTRRLDGVTIDAGARTATIDAGVRWATVVGAAAEFGLAPITGSAATVGVVGYLLGGGVGPLARSHGFSADYLLGLTVVTGQGELVEADADRDPDLFWALRGGKTGLGVVVQVRLRLVELRTLYGGSLFFDEPDIETALRARVDWTGTADPRVTTSAAIIHFPPLDTVPEPMRGRRLLNLRFAYPGAAEDGAALAHAGAGTTAPFVVAEVRHLGSATHQDVPTGSAVSGRGADYSLVLIAADPRTFGAAVVAAAALAAAVEPWISAETNPNYPAMLSSPPPAGSAPNALSSEREARLAQVRHHYDPEGLFA